MSDENFENMTHQHFYENYFLIDGKKPPPLSDFYKQLFAAYDNLKAGEHIGIVTSRPGRTIIYKCIQEKAIKSLNNSR